VAHRFFLLGLIGSMLLMVVPAMAQDDTASNAVTIFMSPPESLDPVSLSRFDTSARDIVDNIFVGLTRLNTRTGQVEPWLADSWTVSDNGLVWTFTLRDDIQWMQYDPTAGTAIALRPVVAEDVAFAVQRACDPDRPSPANTNLYIIDGCRPLVTNNSNFPSNPQRVNIVALDNTTLQITLLFPASHFLSITTLPEMRPLPSEFINDSVGNYPRPNAIVTSGAWVVADWQDNIAMQLTRNSEWPEDFEGNVSDVTLRFDGFLEALPTDIQAGAIDFARFSSDFLLPASFPDDFVGSNDGNTITLLGFSYNNVSAEGTAIVSPLDSPDVRRALALALDRELLVQTIFGEARQVSENFTPNSVVGAPSSAGANADIVTAQNLLAQAGYANCTNMGQLAFAVSSNPIEFQLAQNIVFQWQTNLGCPAETFPISQTTRIAILESAHNTVDVTVAGRFPLWILNWTGDYPDAQAWVGDALHCEYGYLQVGRQCNIIDTQIDYASTTLDIIERANTYSQIESQLFGSQGSFPVIPLIVEQTWWVKQPSLTNIASYGTQQFDRWLVNESTP